MIVLIPSNLCAARLLRPPGRSSSPVPVQIPVGNRPLLFISCSLCLWRCAYLKYRLQRCYWAAYKESRQTWLYHFDYPPRNLIWTSARAALTETDEENVAGGPVSKEVVGVHVLLTRSLFACDILRRLLLRVSLAKPTFAALRF